MFVLTLRPTCCQIPHDNAEPFSSNDGLTYRRVRFLVSANSTRKSNSSNAGKSIRTKFRNDDSSVLSKSVNSLLYAPHIGLSIIHDFTHTERRRRRRRLWASTTPAIAMKQQAVYRQLLCQRHPCWECLMIDRSTSRPLVINIHKLLPERAFSSVDPLHTIVCRPHTIVHPLHTIVICSQHTIVCSVR